MQITGLITEYNPFHNGHAYHIQAAKQTAGADYCVALMSGSFVQRGEPAVFDKYERALMALRAGADLVLELPFPFSTASAREFAAFGVALFSALGVDSLVFGSECGRIEPLSQVAALLLAEQPAFQRELKSQLRRGQTWPKARAAALSALAGVSPAGPLLTPESVSALLATPNNILGIEYLRAGMALQSPLAFHTIRRRGSAYHDRALPGQADEAPHSGSAAPERDADLARPNGAAPGQTADPPRPGGAASEQPTDPPRPDGRLLPSASALRRLLEHAYSQWDGTGPVPDAARLLQGYVPPQALPALAGAVPVFPDDLSDFLNYRLLLSAWPPIADLTPELEARLRRGAYAPLSFTERVRALKSRELTYTRVSRALLHLTLNLTREETDGWKAAGYAPYARILGFSRKSAPLLSCLKRRSQIPLLAKTADARARLSPGARSMLECEIRAAHLWQTMRQTKIAGFPGPLPRNAGSAFKNEYTAGLVILP